MVGVEALDNTRTRDIANILTIPLLWPMEEIAHILGEWQQHISRGGASVFHASPFIINENIALVDICNLDHESTSGRRGGSNHPLITVPFGGGICAELV
jgi:hypothetical protein